VVAVVAEVEAMVVVAGDTVVVEALEEDMAVAALVVEGGTFPVGRGKGAALLFVFIFACHPATSFHKTHSLS
jgi:hypothetical protein